MNPTLRMLISAALAVLIGTTAAEFARNQLATVHAELAGIVGR